MLGLWNKNFHVEKPLCRSFSELKLLQKMFIDKKAIVSIGTMRRYSGIYKIAKEIIYSGRFGEIEKVTIAFGNAPALGATPILLT